MAGLTKKGEVYYAIFRLNGRTKWKRIGKVTYREAKEYLKRLESKSDKEKLGLINITHVTFNQFSIQYLAYSRANKALDTWKSENWSVRALSQRFGTMRLDAIDEVQIELYKAERQGQGVSNRTINIELLCLSGLFRKAIDARHLAFLPKIKKLTEQKKPPRFLSKSELELLFNSASLWLKFILIVLRNAGLRSKQLRELQIDNTDFDRNLLTILNTKGNDYYTVPMTEELKAGLLFLKDNYVSPLCKVSPRKDHQRIYYFCKQDGKPITSFKTSFNKAVKRAGLKNVTPHVLRHTFASHLVMNGVDLPTVKELLGHKSITTTMIYAHLSSEHKERAIKKLPWGEPKLKLA